MTTIEDVLKGLTQYPLPSETLKSVAARRGYKAYSSFCRLFFVLGVQ